MSVEVRALRENEQEACLDLWDAAFPFTGRPYFRRYFEGDVEWLPYYTQVAVLDGQIVSAAHICKRIVACGDFRLTMGGIANVATLPEQRGKGYNTACLQAAIRVMEADAMDFSLLFTGIFGYYGRVGYEPVDFPRVEGPVKTDFTPSPSPYSLRPVQDADLPALRRIHAAYNRRRPIAVERSEACWRDWISLAPGRFPRKRQYTSRFPLRVRRSAMSGTKSSRIIRAL